MNISTIGDILKKRIKEQGYTQQEFADVCGIDISTLQNYMRGIRMYKYDLLEVFADKLNCTYDYLLGKSEVPEREYQDMRNETGLSIYAIDELKKIYSRGQIDIINRIFESEKFMERLIGYFEPTEGTKQGWEFLQSLIFQSTNLNERDKKGLEMYDLDTMFTQQIMVDLALMKKEYVESKK